MDQSSVKYGSICCGIFSSGFKISQPWAFTNEVVYLINARSICTQYFSVENTYLREPRTDTDSALSIKMDGVSRAVSHEHNTTPSLQTGGQNNALYIIEESVVLSHLDAGTLGATGEILTIREVSY